MWAGTASALGRKERKDERAKTGNTPQETASPQEEDVLELGKNVPRVSSSDGSGGSRSHHPLPVCRRKSPEAKRTHGAIRQGSDRPGNRRIVEVGTEREPSPAGACREGTRQSEVRFPELIGNAKVLIYRYRLNPPSCEYINLVVRGILGYTPEEF